LGDSGSGNFTESLDKCSGEELARLAKAAGVEPASFTMMSRETKIVTIRARRESALRFAAVSAGIIGAEKMPVAQLAVALKEQRSSDSSSSSSSSSDEEEEEEEEEEAVAPGGGWKASMQRAATKSQFAAMAAKGKRGKESGRKKESKASRGSGGKEPEGSEGSEEWDEPSVIGALDQPPRSSPLASSEETDERTGSFDASAHPPKATAGKREKPRVAQPFKFARKASDTRETPDESEDDEDDDDSSSDLRDDETSRRKKTRRKREVSDSSSSSSSSESSSSEGARQTVVKRQSSKGSRSSKGSIADRHADAGLIEELEQDIQALQEKNARLNRQAQDDADEIQRATLDRIEADLRVDKLTSERKLLAQKLEARDQTFAALQHLCDSRGADLQVLREDLELMTEEQRELNERMDRIVSERLQTKGAMAKAGSDNKQLGVRIKELEETLAITEAKLDETREHEMNFRKQYKRENLRAQDLISQVEDMKEFIEEAKVIVEEKNKYLEENEEDRKFLKQKNVALEDDLVARRLQGYEDEKKIAGLDEALQFL
jgi:hypothetical protein